MKSWTISPGPIAALRGSVFFGKTFVLCYLANLLLYTAHALMFRFADFVAHVGGTEADTGRIVSVGLVVAIAWRLGLGASIDRLGPRIPWIGSIVLYLAGCGLFFASREVSFLIYLARTLFAVGFAGMLASGMTAVQTLVTGGRRTEIIGILESSAFLGLLLGSVAGQRLFSTISGEARFALMFGAVVAVGVLNLGIVLTLTKGARRGAAPEAADAAQARPALPLPRWARRLGPLLEYVHLDRVFAYWSPGLVLALLGVGLNFAVTTLFLSRFFASRHLATGMQTFFVAYCAFSYPLRFLTRSWGERLGNGTMIAWGLAVMALGQLLFIPATEEWHLLFPALGCAVARGLVYPAALSAGAGSFPSAARASGTALALAFIDLGLMISAPLLGLVIDHLGYVPMFATTGLWIVAALAISQATDRRRILEPGLSPAKGTTNE